MANPIENALAVATAQWSIAKKNYEHACRALADAETQLHHAERDLHELARATELIAANPNTVTVPLVTVPPNPNGSGALGPVPDDGLDAAEIVRQEMIKMRTGGA